MTDGEGTLRRPDPTDYHTAYAPRRAGLESLKLPLHGLGAAYAVWCGVAPALGLGCWAWLPALPLYLGLSFGWVAVWLWRYGDDL